MDNSSGVSGGFDNNSILNTTYSILLHGTTAHGPTPRPATPPPLGYYGETKQTLWNVIPPIIMVWGTVGNMLTFLVILRKKKTLSSTAMYLMTLAVSDTVVLFTGPLRQWLKQTWDYDIRYLSDVGCKIQVYITYTSLHFSSWLLVAVTLERAISVVLPHKVKIGCTPRNAVIVISSLFVFTFGINIIHLVIMGLDAHRDQQTCAPTSLAYLNFRDDIYQWIDLCIAFAAPFIFLIAGNVVIIVYLQKSRVKQNNMTATRGHGGRIHGRDTTSVSVLLVALSVIFFVTMTPASIFAVYYPYRFDQIYELFRTDPYTAWYDYQYLLFQHAIVNLISYTNASCNFILYVFSGTKFRTELVDMLRCRKAETAGVFCTTSKPDARGKTTTTTTTASQLSADRSSSTGMDSRILPGGGVPSNKWSGSNVTGHRQMFNETTEQTNRGRNSTCDDNHGNEDTICDDVIYSSAISQHDVSQIDVDIDTHV